MDLRFKTIRIDVLAEVGNLAPTPRDWKEVLRQLDLEIYQDWDFTLATLEYALDQLDQELELELDVESLISLKARLHQAQERVIQAIKSKNAS